MKIISSYLSLSLLLSSQAVQGTTMPSSPPTEEQSIAMSSGDGGRLVAFVANWLPCPTPDQYDQYTHIMLAFAVSYTWASGKNICSETCEIATPSVCDNAPNPELIQEWKSKGKKVLLSFGGAGMGGSWNGNDDCWEHCYGRQDDVIDSLTTIVTDMDLDGIDIDYEYYHEDFQNDSDFDRGEEARDFLVDITEGLRSSLGEEAIIAYSPMDPDAQPGTGMWDVLDRVKDTLDFVMPQYYNGYVLNDDDQMTHMANIAELLFSGDMSKVVSGFCIDACQSFSKTGMEAASTLQTIQKTFPCHGGAFFWVSDGDTGGSWSIPVSSALANMNCDGGGSTTAPTTATSITLTPSSSSPPTEEIFITSAPTSAPTKATLDTAAPTTTSSTTSSPTKVTTSPSYVATSVPTNGATPQPSSVETSFPTSTPTRLPTSFPTAAPTVKAVVTSAPTAAPTSPPTSVPTPKASPPSTPTTTYANFCGTNAGDALKCSVACPGGQQVECPIGEFCFAGISCTATPPTNTVKGNYCGAVGNWEDAGKCETPCPQGLNGECPIGEACYASISCPAN